jgi:hypothetical protein
MCDAPPESQIMMALLAIFRRELFPAPVVPAEAKFARLAPKKLNPPATRKVRRSTG